MIHRIKRVAKKKSFIGVCSVIAIAGTIIGIQQNGVIEPTRYVLAAATRGSIITSISASGQVSAENELDVKPSVSGAIIKTYVELGQEVTTNDPLFEIDKQTALKTVRSAEQSVRDAQLSLESAKISYEKLIQPQDNSSLLQAQNALNQAERNLAKLQEPPDALAVMKAEAKVRAAEQDVKLEADGETPKVVRDVYDKNVIALKNLIVTLRKALDDSNDILGVDGQVSNIYFTNLFSVLDQGKRIQAYTSYDLAKSVIEKARDAVDPLQLSEEDMDQIEVAMITVDDALKITVDFLEDMKDGLDASLTSSSFSQSSLDQYKSTIQSDINSITNAYGTIESQQDSIAEAYVTYDNALTTLAQAEAELADLMAGPDPEDVAAALETVEERRQSLEDSKDGAEDIEIKTSLNTIAQRNSSLQNARDALRDAVEELNDHTVRAPFDGVIAKIAVKNTDQVSASTVLTTLLTKAKIAQVSLNEVDVSNVKVGQKATLTFDAVQDLTIAGSVSEVDMVGTVSQGVVTYAIKIAFLTEDERIKSGMTVSASIVTDMRSDVVIVPNTAIQSSVGSAYVSILEGVPLNSSSTGSGVPSETLPKNAPVTTGLSNDQYTEIIEGLNEGDPVIVRTIQPTSSTTNQTAASGASQNSTMRIPGVSSMGSGGFTGSMMRR
ncbi:efflux RND transporter periplasmic adaptor subunit [Patescibacteria group bacterium]|nr:efflux RND transporter periplasmic adaptor subunit [Patescibacteria group bacterium]